jgi:hypothetical protein
VPVQAPFLKPQPLDEGNDEGRFAAAILQVRVDPVQCYEIRRRVRVLLEKF